MKLATDGELLQLKKEDIFKCDINSEGVVQLVLKKSKFKEFMNKAKILTEGGDPNWKKPKNLEKFVDLLKSAGYQFSTQVKMVEVFSESAWKDWQKDAARAEWFKKKISGERKKPIWE